MHKYIIAAVVVIWVLGIFAIPAPPPPNNDIPAPQPVPIPTPTLAPTVTPTLPPTRMPGNLSPVFTDEVMYWEQDIVMWAQTHNLDPNIAAIIMQIESCGNQRAVSPAGAMGLFQVMPFHFTAGDDMLDPDTNANAGLGFYSSLLQRSGNVSLSLAAYNGGGSIFNKTWNNWPYETRRYYYWGKGIYDDIQEELATSPTLNEWMAAGGQGLCDLAKYSQE